MGQSLVGRLAIRARQVQPGDAFAAAVPAGGLIEIIDLDGMQVAEMVAFDQADTSERLSLGVTRRESRSVMLSLGMKLYSSRGRAMLDLVEDTVGRHDLLWSAPTGASPAAPAIEPTEAEPNPGVDAASPLHEGVVVTPVADPTEHSAATDLDGDAGVGPATAHVAQQQDSAPGTTESSNDLNDAGTDLMASAPTNGTDAGPAVGTVQRPTGFAAALEPFGLGDADVPDPVNFFMQVAVMQRGDLELRNPLSERGDRVVLQALSDVVVAVRCSSATDETNGDSPSDILVRVYR